MTDMLVNYTNFHLTDLGGPLLTEFWIYEIIHPEIVRTF